MPSPNRLAREKSPYLLQHANNPVDWYPWGDEAFAKARAEDKPIFLSIGYSTCHWCHVMERESFESEEIAAVLNEHFISIKVDREERPDIDRIYMMFVQATTGSGGWPMSVWLTPDLTPFFGGTYFPPDNRYGRPGFPALLEYIAQVWSGDRARIVESGSDVVAELQRHADVRPLAAELLDDSGVESCFHALRRTFDTRRGGFGEAPKFPRAAAFNFLFRYWSHSGNAEARDMVLKTLDEMAKGGMYDQVGGGFHRYSVDERWFVPHFEKMLYDQAQLAVSYLEAFQITGDQRHAAVARDIFEYVLRDMRDPGGGFYSAEDADSVIDPAHPHEKGEGAFYMWTQAEIEQVLGGDAEWFCRAFGVRPNGNVDQDPHQEFTGRNILFRAGEVTGDFEAARAKLLEARSQRIRPHLDDKILTSWNGLMISAFALGGRALGEPRYTEAARRAADFILAQMSVGRALKRRFREGEAAIDGFLDDYSYFINALLDLWETVFDWNYLDRAVRFAETVIARFEDRDAGGFFSTAEGDASLILRMKEDYDGAEPSGNSMAAIALLRLAAIVGREDFARAADRTLHAFAPRMRAGAAGLPQMLVAYLLYRGGPKQIVIAGDEVSAMLKAVQQRFLPGRSLIVVRTDEDRARFPGLAGKAPIGGRAAAYVCENFACQLPVTNVDELVQLLQ
jgi:hypothetical protein